MRFQPRSWLVTVLAGVFLCGTASADSQARQLARQAYLTIRDHPFEGQILQQAAKQLDQAATLDRNEAYVSLAAAALIETLGYRHGEWSNAHSFEPGVLSEATRLAQQAVRAAPDLAEPHAELGRLYTTQRQFNEALREYYLAHKLDPENFRVWFGQAVCWWKQGNARKAEAALAGAEARARTTKDRLRVLNQKQQMAVSRSDHAEVERLLREKIALEPESPWAHGNYAGFLMGRARFDQAIVEYEKAIKLGSYPIAVEGLEEAKRLRRNATKRSP